MTVISPPATQAPASAAFNVRTAGDARQRKRATLLILSAVVGLTVLGALAMVWMADHRPPHPGTPLAARLIAIRGLWPADRRGGAAVAAIAATVLTVDIVMVWALSRDARWTASRMGAALGALAVITALQVLHQGEHVVQVLQLLVTGGNADVSQGIVTRLNQEVVHAVWTTVIWVGSLVLLFRMPRNPWMWALLVAASVHEVEHVYLLFAWLQPPIYLHGGINGVFATGGLFGGPLQRPYLHFLYNLVETLLLCATLAEALRVNGYRISGIRGVPFLHR
jgi:hypothetical protein